MALLAWDAGLRDRENLAPNTEPVKRMTLGVTASLRARKSVGSEGRERRSGPAQTPLHGKSKRAADATPPVGGIFGF